MRLVLLPGMDGTGLLFSRLAEALGDGLKTTVVRYPATSQLGYADLEGVVRASLPTEEPFILLGESFSGPIAISIAASKPPGLRGLILCCSFARNPVPILAGLRFLVRFIPFRLVPSVLLNPLLLGRFSSAPLRAEVAKALCQVSDSALQARIQALLAVDASAKLRDVAVPILYLRASKDRLVHRRASEHLQRVAPALRVVELEGPHLLLQAMSVASAAAIRDFAREVRAGLLPAPSVPPPSPD